MAKILVVDDSITVRDQVCQALHDAGHETIEGEDGEDGLTKAREHLDIDLIISDYNMPRIDGISMITKIREISGQEKKPVLMLTTERNDELKMLGKKVGVIAWVVKPFEPSRLTMVLEKILQRAAG